MAFAAMQNRLLRAGGVRIPPGRLLALTTAAGSIASSIPAGPAVASVFAYHQYRRYGADEALSAWTLIASFVASALGLAILAAGGVLLAEREGAAYDLIGVTLSVLVVAVLAAVVLWQRSRLSQAGLVALRACRRVTGRPKRHESEVLGAIIDQLGRVNLSWRDFAVTLVWSIANWVFDCGCLAFGYLAIHAAIPFRGLLLAYGAGQLASNLPITPGGLGVVEGSLTIALVAFGGSHASTVAAVLLYRIVSFWGYIPVGWLTYLGIRLVDGRADRVVA